MSLQEALKTNNTFVNEYIEKEKFVNYVSVPRRNVFQHFAWIKAIEEGLGYSPFGLITKHNNIPVCISIFFQYKKLFLKLAGSPLAGSFTPYLEPIWLGEVDNEAKQLTLLSQEKFLIDQGFSYIERRFKNGNFVENMKENSKGKILFPETFILEIKSDVEDMWNTIKSKTRNMVRKAKKQGVILKKSKGSDNEITILYKMLKKVFAKRNTTPPHPIDFYKSIVRNLSPEDKLLVLSAHYKNEPIAMGLFIYDHKEIHFLSGASFEQAYKTGANNLIQWGAIEFAVKKGLKIYDMGGKGIPSIDRFKASFGAEPHRYGRVVWASTIAKIAEGMFIRFRKIKGYLVSKTF